MDSFCKNRGGQWRLQAATVKSARAHVADERVSRVVVHAANVAGLTILLLDSTVGAMRARRHVITERSGVVSKVHPVGMRNGRLTPALGTKPSDSRSIV